jgi:TonB-linked SusC/RagA family outer membrane protein
MMGLLFALQTDAQTQVTGTVVDGKSHEPLIGVTVRQVGQQTGTVTDLDGNFKLSVPEGTPLEFSYIGYITLTLKAKAQMSVTLMEDQQSLDEVVVVGYGVQKKSSLTGAVSSVKSMDLENRSVTNINSALAGKTAGLQAYSSTAAPGATPNVQIRGIGSNGSSTPLFVIDGRVASGTGGLDPNDIESIEVLKDGASAAIYGASAGNGVILITTKKGKGEGSISFDMQLTSQSINKVPKVMNSEEFIDYYNEMGTLSMTTVYNNWDFKQNTDWADVALEPSLMQRYNLKLQKGTDKGNYYVSVGFLDNNGMVVGDHDTYRRFSGMVNASYKIKPWLEVGTNNDIEYTRTHAITEGGEDENLFTTILNLDPMTAPTYTLDNMPQNMRTVLANPEQYGELLSDGKGNYYGVSPYVSTNRINPLILINNNYNEGRTLTVSGTAYVNLMPIKGLVITSRFGYSFVNNEYYLANYDYYSDYGSGKYRNYLGVTASNNNSNYWQWENFLNYSHDFGDHHLGVMLGTSYSENRTYGVSGTMTGNSNGELGFTKDAPNYLYFAYATEGATKSVSGGEPIFTRKLAYFGRLSYSYRDTYLAQFSLRADAADLSVLPKDNRWGYFPAASLGWVVSNEKWMQGTQSWLTHLKLRASWGRNGSIASLGSYMYDAVIAKYGSYHFSNNTDYSYGYAPTSMGNNNLKWETSEQLDLGLDLRMLNNRLSFTMDYFKKDTKDLIIAGATLSNITGYSASPINAGKLTNKGFEFEIGWQDRIRDFTYNVRTNMSTLKNEVTKVYDTVDAIDGKTIVTSPVTRFKKGEPAWYFYGYKYLGVDEATGDPMFEDINKDGIISEDDKTYIGKGIPDFAYGITLNMAWKGIDFLVFGSGVAGVDIFNCYDVSDFATNKLKHFTENRWTTDNPQGTNPRAGSNNTLLRYSDARVFDGSYFKIKQIQLGYSLPDAWMHKVGMSHLRLYCSLEDFFTITNYIGYDPEVTGTGNATGVDMGLYPNTKKVIFGLNLTF